jgi:hypothetical protein
MKRSFAAVRIISAALLGGTAGTIVGCSDNSTSSHRMTSGSGVKEIPVDSSSRAFALENYRSAVLAEVRAQPDATFVTRPDISMGHRPDGSTELMAMGEMDINDKGARMRKLYSVTWVKSGGGWTSPVTLIMEGKPSPQPLRPVATTGPAYIRSSTQPTTPADPTAAPPPSNAPSAVPGAGVPGGTTTLPPSGGSGSPSLPPP